jgi:hypothetical protein
MTETVKTFRVINITEAKNVVTGLSLDRAHDVLRDMQKTYKDSKYTLGPDVVEAVAS